MQATSSGAGGGPGRTPAHIRRDGNRLKDEPSLYLRQHAQNPVDWCPWGEEGLARARTEDKPVFLSVGYASCHWCHVMEHEVFEDDEVAAFLNAHFVCIKVDREERPDLDHVYMQAVQALTGRGGWPMSVFLTPALEPFYGGTYFPRPQFLSLVRQIVEVYRDRKEDLEAQAAHLAAEIMARTAGQAGGNAPLAVEIADAAVAGAAQYFDPVNGGFNQGQKFPTPVKWRFLLRTFRRTGDPELGGMVRRTLEAMAQGGIYDHVGGGFHRYTVDETWTVPHFEKMLYDNGQLAGLFLEAGAVFGREDFTAAGTDVLDFLLRDMRGSDGGFFASYDADSDGQEGTYYVWSAAEIAAAIGADEGPDEGTNDGANEGTVEGPVLAELLGVDEHGNFEHSGKSVLTRRADLDTIAARSGRSRADLEGLFARHRPALRAARDLRPTPGLDRKVVTSWNGLVIASLAQGFAATGESAYRDGAVKAADFLLERHRRDDGSLWRTSTEGRPSGEGILDDYAMLADALLELCQVCDDPVLQVRYLRAARELIDFTRHEFGRAEGGYYLSRAAADAPLGRTLETFDGVEPAGMAVMVQALIKLAAITGEAGYLEEARTCLQDWAGLMQRAGIEMALWCDAVTKVCEPFFDVVIAGNGRGDGDGRSDGQDDRAEALAAAFLRRLPHNAVLSRVPAAGAGEDLLALAPALAGKTAVGGRATAYVCEFGTCREPTENAEIMLERLDPSAGLSG